MHFPSSLWTHPDDLALVESLLLVFQQEPLILTDQLTNSVFFNEAAEQFYGERGEALVNRVAFSLLGIDDGQRQPPPGLVKALSGEGPSWRGLVRLPGLRLDTPVLVEGSAIVRPGEGKLVAGVLRLLPKETQPPGGGR